MTNQEQLQPKKESASSVILKVVLILIGVLLVLVIGVWLGRTIAGDSLPEGPEIVLPPPPPDVPYAVANFYVNIRSGPGTEHPAYGVAAPGSSAEIIGVSPIKNGGWSDCQRRFLQMEQDGCQLNTLPLITPIKYRCRSRMQNLNPIFITLGFN